MDLRVSGANRASMGLERHELWDRVSRPQRVRAYSGMEKALGRTCTEGLGNGGGYCTG